MYVFVWVFVCVRVTVCVYGMEHQKLFWTINKVNRRQKWVTCSSRHWMACANKAKGWLQMYIMQQTALCLVFHPDSTSHPPLITLSLFAHRHLSPSSALVISQAVLLHGKYFVRLKWESDTNRANRVECTVQHIDRTHTIVDRFHIELNCVIDSRHVVGGN